MINFFNGEPTETQKKEIENQLINKHAGSENAGKFILNFADSRDKGAEITPIAPNGLVDLFNTLNEQISKELMIAHKVVNPALFGVPTTGGLGNNADELIIASMSFQNRYATPKQEDLETVFNGILELNGLPGLLNIKPLEPISKPIDNNVKMSVMTKAEQREMLGLEVLEEEKTNGVADAISMLSPLVAAKVLDTLSNNELRELIGLTGSVVVPEVKETFKNNYELANDLENLTTHLELNGLPADNFEILSAVDIEFSNDAEFNEFHNKTKLNFAAIPNLSANDLKVLSAIAQNPAASTEQLAQSTQLEVPEVQESIKNLNKAGAIDEVPGDTGQVNREVTKDGNDSIPAEDKTIFVKYRYVTRADVPSAKKSRNFCSRLIAANLLYEKSDIDTMSNSQGLSVWEHRGGFYNNPLTGRTQSHCRHIWQQVIVREVKKD